MQSKLSKEIIDLLNNRVAMRMKHDTHKMAEANKSYAHFNPKKNTT